MNFVEDILAETFFSMPGAFVRWNWIEKEKSFWQYLKNDSIYNFLLNLIIYGVIAILVFC